MVKTNKKRTHLINCVASQNGFIFLLSHDYLLTHEFWTRDTSQCESIRIDSQFEKGQWNMLRKWDIREGLMVNDRYCFFWQLTIGLYGLNQKSKSYRIKTIIFDGRTQSVFFFFFLLYLFKQFKTSRRCSKNHV